ncbi:MAG: glutamine synthetase [Candidatus Micrarchaeota archaeon]|nr:glutamine synthetase [Candidatus Micrarchaeota archaeon]MCX8154452.1 glutamine synthetase [Candidatus Micrarchaeota archaeon]
MDLEDIKRRMDSDRIEYISLQFPNIFGEIKEIFVNRNRIEAGILDYGYFHRDLNSLFGEDVALRPMLNTYQVLPWYALTARFMSRLVQGDRISEIDMFLGLEKVVDRLRGIGIEMLVQPSVEFYVLENVNVDRMMKDKGPVVNIDTKEGKWNTSFFPQKENIFSSYPSDIYSGVRQQLVRDLRTFGYETDAHYHSYSTSQHKIVFDHMDPIRAAQAILDMKYISRVMGNLSNLHISYSPYLFTNQRGNTLEIKISGDFIENGELKEKIRYFVAGILEHMLSIMLFTNPSIASYRRLQNEGMFRCYSYSSAMGVAIQISKRDRGSISLLFPDSSAHPILSLVAILGAGYDGVKNKTPLDYEVTTSPKMMSNREIRERKITRLPDTLREVLEAIDSDRSYLKEFMSTDILNEYIDLKNQEFKEFMTNPTLEYERYL